MAPTSSDRNRRNTSGRRGARTTNRPNRAQLQAMEIRAAETGAAAAVPRTQSITSAPRRGRAVARSVGLTRDAEMQYIRTDLRRLLYTAGVLLVLMIVLLIFIN